MKKLITIFMLLVLASLPLFSEKYSEVADLMNAMYDHVNEYADAVEKAETAEEMAEIMIEYSRLIQQDQIALMAIEVKYPELAEMDEPPAELAPIVEKLENLGERMQQITVKMMQFMEDPAMQEASATIMAEMQAAMSEEE